MITSKTSSFSTVTSVSTTFITSSQFTVATTPVIKSSTSVIQTSVSAINSNSSVIQPITTTKLVAQFNLKFFFVSPLSNLTEIEISKYVVALSRSLGIPSKFINISTSVLSKRRLLFENLGTTLYVTIYSSDESLILGLKEDIQNVDFIKKFDNELQSLNLGSVLLDQNSVVIVYPNPVEITPKTPDSASDNNLPLIIGGAVGGGLGFVLLLAVCFICLQSKQDYFQTKPSKSSFKYTSIKIK